jgi:hypothetical protein
MEDSMSIQKKSLISNRATVKKAVIAKSSLEPQTVATKSKYEFKSAHQSAFATSHPARNTKSFKSALAQTKSTYKTKI